MIKHNKTLFFSYLSSLIEISGNDVI